MRGRHDKKNTVTRVVIFLNKTLGEQIGEQIGGEQITVIIHTYLMAFNNILARPTRIVLNVPYIYNTVR